MSYTAPIKDMMFVIEHLSGLKDITALPGREQFDADTALGHPLGAMGAIRACTVIHGLRRTQKRYGMVTICIGTGMGAAGIFERL